ncbi:MAG: hypothetical protein JWP57_2148, partial [Spirosoma sp.]|nr:hypothetical protein [Spirosoma sp.]
MVGLNRFITLVLLLLTSALGAVAQPTMQKKIQTDLIMADDGAVIELPAGTFALTGSLSLQDKNNITIRGAGEGKTVLSFKGQTEGAEGLRVTNGQKIIIENLTVQDTKGDGIKTMNVRGIT